MERTFVPLQALSARLGLSRTWLRREADAGRIPCLRAGRRLMFDPDDVERTLIERARAATAPEAGMAVAQ